jgi:hypothetical protein
MRILAYGIAANYTYEYLSIGEDTSIKSVCLFSKIMIHVFRENYLRTRDEEDTKRLMAQNAARGWPRMLGSIDYMHWSGRFARQHGTVSTLAIIVIQTLYLKKWPRRISGSSMTSLACKDL